MTQYLCKASCPLIKLHQLFQNSGNNSSSIESYHRENTFVRSVSNIDPTKSGVLLTYLDIIHVVKWYQDLRKLQKKHPYDQLEWSSFISGAMTLRISAYNDSKKIFRRNIMDRNGSYIA
jgi:hypothetical protein